MNRRGFLQFVGAFAAGAAIPFVVAPEKIARAPAWAKHVRVYRTAPLAAGIYTFSASSPKGLFVAGVTASGGETLVEIPCEPGDIFGHAVLNTHGVFIQPPPTPSVFDFTEQGTFGQLDRGTDNALVVEGARDRTNHLLWTA